MKLISEKYRKLLPTIDYLTDPVVLTQAWKKSHQYIRHSNWYADTLELDSSALSLEEKIESWSSELEKNSSTEMELVLAGKSQQWHFVKNDDDEENWCPKIENDNDKIPLRPLAHLGIQDQVYATAIMMCLADAVESAQGNCDVSGASLLENHSKVVSYGNRLNCDWKDGKAWFRWGNSDVYRKFFTDYQSFQKRPIEIGRYIANTQSDIDHVYVINFDLTKFYDNIDCSELIKRLKEIVQKQGIKSKDEFWKTVEHRFQWAWSEDSVKRSEEVGLELGKGLPQGLVSSGFLANAYMMNFDQKVTEELSKIIEKQEPILVHDYSRYVDDIRLVVSVDGELEPKQIQAICQKSISEVLQKHAGEKIELNKEKTKIAVLSELDSQANLDTKIEIIQSQLSGPFDRDILDSNLGILEGFLNIDDESDFGQSDSTSPFRESTHIPRNMRADTIKRFSANRIEKLVRTKRRILKGVKDEELSLAELKSANESELLAKKLIHAWSKDPSLALVLRKAMEIYPSATLFEPVFDEIFDNSSFGKKKNPNTNAMMDYQMADLFRCTIDMQVTFTREEYTERLIPHELIKLICTYAQKIVEKPNCPPFLLRQGLLLLAVNNRPILPILDLEQPRSAHETLHAIMIKSISDFEKKHKALYEISAQITGEFNLTAKFLLESIPADSLQTELVDFAKRGGPFWIAIWERLSSKKEFKECRKSLEWAKPISVGTPKPMKQALSKVIASKENVFQHERPLVLLALGLIDKIPQPDKNVKNFGAPRDLKVSLNKHGYSWEDLLNPTKSKNLNVQRNGPTSAKNSDPRFEAPGWIAENDENSDRQVIYWIGAILRAALLGGSDFTGIKYKNRRDYIPRYSGIRSTWFKRRMGMMHSPESIVGEFSTVSNWFSELLMCCLQWPGFEATYIRFEEIKKISDLASLKSVLENRLSFLNTTFLSGANLPTVTTNISRDHSNQFSGFRIVTVQSLIPQQSDFCFADPKLDTPQIRAKHREHVMNACYLAYKTIETKLHAENHKDKPSADLIVFPEISVHHEDQDLLKRLADKTGAIIFAGLVFRDHEEKLVNTARWIIPDKRESGRNWIIRDQGKQNMTDGEKRLGIAGYRPCQHIIEIDGHPEGPFRMTGAICFDATDIKLAADLRDQTDLFIVAAHNKDVNTFDNMAAALNYHMYQHVAVSNIGEFGGSTIQAPYREPYNRLISHTHGVKQISINIADIDLAAFRRESMNHRKTKSQPAGIERIIAN